MRDALLAVVVVIGGVAAGAALGWPAGRRAGEDTRSRAIAFAALFLAGIGAAWWGLASGLPLVTNASLGFAFGGIGAIKYASGIVSLEPRAAVRSEAAADGAADADAGSGVVKTAEKDG